MSVRPTYQELEHLVYFLLDNSMLKLDANGNAPDDDKAYKTLTFLKNNRPPEIKLGACGSCLYCKHDQETGYDICTLRFGRKVDPNSRCDSFYNRLKAAGL